MTTRLVISSLGINDLMPLTYYSSLKKRRSYLLPEMTNCSESLLGKSSLMSLSLETYSFSRTLRSLALHEEEPCEAMTIEFSRLYVSYRYWSFWNEGSYVFG